MVASTATINAPDAAVAVGFFAAFCLILAVTVGAIDWVADRVDRWLERRDIREHLRWWARHRADLAVWDPPRPEPSQFWTRRGTCEQGFHREFVENPDGIHVCADCGSVDVVPQPHPCSCGRGPIVLLVGFEACCALCAVEKVPGIGAMLRHPSAASMRGAFSDLTGGLRAEEWIRQQRHRDGTEVAS